MPVKIVSAYTIGVEAKRLEIEVDVTSISGIHQFKGIGLSPSNVGDTKQRIFTALSNASILDNPLHVIVNVSPNIKSGEINILDMTLLVGILQSIKKITDSSLVKESLFMGEVGLDGKFRSIKGGMVIADYAQKNGIKRLIVPFENAQECSSIKEIDIIGVSDIHQLISFLNGKIAIKPTIYKNHGESKKNSIDYSDIKGQHQAKRALQIAAAGRHNILFMGPPGSGKTMLSERLYTIMPEMTFQEKIESSKIFSVAGLLKEGSLIHNRPFRAPHHAISYVGLVGGGNPPRPGEISLAHKGILFLDELAEFTTKCLDMLRQPLESRHITITRANYTIDLPADTILVGAFNPCPCGYFNDPKRKCACSSGDIARYLGKISGPLLDRMDLQVFIQSVEIEDLIISGKDPISSEELKKGVDIAVKRQNGNWNNDIKASEINDICTMTQDAQDLMKIAFDKLKLTVRSYHKIMKISKTIADLEDENIIQEKHVKEALTYRSIDNIVSRYRV